MVECVRGDVESREMFYVEMSSAECRVKFKNQCVLVVDLGLVMNAPD